MLVAMPAHKMNLRAAMKMKKENLRSLKKLADLHYLTKELELHLLKI